MFSLNGRRSLVTGAAGGLGLAIVDALADCGADVAAIDINQRSLTGAINALREKHPNRKFVAIESDVTNEDSVRKALEAAATRIGTINTLVNVAGIFKAIRFEQLSFQDWKHMLACHLDGTFLFTRHALPGMLEEGFGRIICTSSVASASGVAYEVAYGAAKGGVEGLVRSLAREVAAHGVTVNAIAPGYFDTPVNVAKPPEEKALLTRNIPAGRFGKPEEVGALAVYLVSDEAAYMTGQVVSPTGAFSYGHADLDSRPD